MILCARNTLCLALVILSASACGMMRDESTSASTSQQQNWFEYAYMSSAVNFETAEDGAARAKPLRLQ